MAALYTFNNLNYGYVAGSGIAILTSLSAIPVSVDILAKFTVSNMEYTVTSIDSNVFQNRTTLTSIIIPNSVTTIYASTFQNCSGLTSITIPNSVTSIGNFTFSGCSALTSITIPNSVTSIGTNAFQNCSGLTSITIPNSVTSIGNFTFSGCSGLTSITIPNSVTSIGASAFTGCSTLSSIIITSSVTSIGANAFQNCSGLTSITIPNSVTSIGPNGDAGYVFSGCSNLVSAILPANITYISGRMFLNCIKLESITIPSSVITVYKSFCYGCSSLKSVTFAPGSLLQTIGVNMFVNCSKLSSITIPSSVTSIGDYAFNGCTSLTSITIPNLVTSIVTDTAFLGASSLTSITVDPANSNYSSDEFGVLYDKPKTILYRCPEGLNVASYIIPSSVPSIGAYAFQNCSKLTSITIPSSVTSIVTDTAFLKASSLTSITVDPANPNYSSDEFGVLFNKLKTILYRYPEKLNVAYIIPTSVTSIGVNAFDNCSILSSIIIPSSVTSIGSSAFLNCSSLNSVYFLGNIPTISASNFTITGDTAYHITGATNITRLSMFTTKTSFSSLLELYTSLGFIQLAPVITSITTSDGTVSINFTQLKNLQIPTITNYAYSTDGINYIDLSPAQISSLLQITGLNNNQIYSFTIKAYNGIYSDASNAVNAQINPNSSATIITSVSYSHPNSAKVYFIQEPNESAPVTGYSYSLDGGQTYTAMNSVTTSPLTISGLKSGLTNSIVLKSNNGQDSIASNIFNFTYHVSKGKKKVLT